MTSDADRLPGLLPSDDRTALVERLDHCRSEVRRIAERVTDDRSTRRLLASTDLTVAGIVRHLAWVEDLWIQARLLGIPLADPWTPEDVSPTASMRLAGSDTLESLLQRYDEACARSRRAIAGIDLDTPTVVASFGRGAVNLRWILSHVISETARHLGHLDLLADAAEHDPR